MEVSTVAAKQRRWTSSHLRLLALSPGASFGGQAHGGVHRSCEAAKVDLKPPPLACTRRAQASVGKLMDVSTESLKNKRAALRRARPPVHFLYRPGEGAERYPCRPLKRRPANAKPVPSSSRLAGSGIADVVKVKLSAKTELPLTAGSVAPKMA